MKNTAKKNNVVIPDEILMNKIYVIRDQKVMLDYDLAKLYGETTKRVKQQVRRNIERFPEDFMFELTKEELENRRLQIATSCFPHFYKTSPGRPNFIEVSFEFGCPVTNFEHVYSQEAQ